MPAATAEMLDWSNAAPAIDAARQGEARLVDSARFGDRAAFARLHERYVRMVHGIALARVPANEAHDLVQDAFVEALANLHTLRDRSAFGPWIAAIARNLAVEFHRRRKTNRPLSAAEDESSRADETANQSAEALRVLNVVLTLPEAYAETLIFRLVEAMTGPQIAVCTGMTPGSVRVNLHRGMQMLRERLGLEKST